MNEAKGGTFAPADMKLIKKALSKYARDCEDSEVHQIANLMHRIGRIDK